MATRKQIEANKRNALKSGGPKSEEGKAVSRLNARKHGIFAAALTKYDKKELHGLYEELADSIRPQGRIEEMLVEKLAHTYLRLQRCARAEAEHHIHTWERKLKISYEIEREERERQYGMHVSDFNFPAFANSVKLFARYDKTLTGQLIQLLHEIERIQRMRQGDQVAPPAVAHLTVELDSEDAA